METLLVGQLTDNVALIQENGKGVSKNDFIEMVSEGWISYLISLPISNTIVEQVAVTTNRHQDHYKDAVSDAVEFFQDYKGEELTEEELALISVNRLVFELKAIAS